MRQLETVSFSESQQSHLIDARQTNKHIRILRLGTICSVRKKLMKHNILEPIMFEDCVFKLCVELKNDIGSNPSNMF